VTVWPRMSERHPDQVTGYAVSLDGWANGAGEPVRFGGGKLAPDLTLPKHAPTVCRCFHVACSTSIRRCRCTCRSLSLRTSTVNPSTRAELGLCRSRCSLIPKVTR
jgi:hypothetical protein